MASATALVGCGDDSDSGAGGSAATSSSSTMSGSSTTSSTSTGGDPATCTEANTFCARFVLPADATGTPTNLIVGLYASLPAGGPPDAGVVVNIPMPDAKPGVPYAIKGTDIMAMGTVTMLANMSMPGGNKYQPVDGIDYDVSSEPLELTGAAFDAGEFELKLHTADDGHTAP